MDLPRPPPFRPPYYPKFSMQKKARKNQPLLKKRLHLSARARRKKKTAPKPHQNRAWLQYVPERGKDSPFRKKIREDKNMVYDTVAGMIAKQLKMDVKDITPDKRLVEDLKADSANVMVMIMDLEDTFNLTVDDTAINTLRTVGDVVKYIEAHQ